MRAAVAGEFSQRGPLVTGDVAGVGRGIGDASDGADRTELRNAAGEA
jgi:hypothetical protein